MDAPRDPTFSFNPRTREVGLRYVYPLAGGSGEHLWAGLKGAIDSAMKWRQGYCLDDE